MAVVWKQRGAEQQPLSCEDHCERPDLALLSKIGDGDCTGLSSRNIQQLVSPRNIGHRSRTAPNPQAQIAGRWTALTSRDRPCHLPDPLF